MEIIDIHTQVLPQGPSAILPEKSRTWARLAAQPLSQALHEGYPYLRFLPSAGRRVLEGVADRILPVPFLLLESSAADLREAMVHSNVNRAVVVADPPRIPNEFVLELASTNPTFIPCVQVPRNDPDPKATLNGLKERGARLLKISDAIQWTETPAAYFEGLAEEANRLRLPLILRISKEARLKTLLPLTRDIPVIIAHMNQNSAELAFDLAEEFPQVHLETSWQPVEVIAEAVRRAGADRVVFGSDWPWMGANISVGLRRVREALASQMITEEDAARILGANARRILGE